MDGVLLHSINNTSKIDLDLDSVIRKIAKELIVVIKQNIKNNPNLIYFDTEAVKEIELVENDEDISLDNVSEKSDQVQTGEETPLENSAEENNSQDQTIPPIVKPEDFRHFIISTGFTPFMTTGNASNYFTFGLGPDLHTAYNFQTSFGYFGLGIYSSLIYFKAEGLIISSENFLISAGPEIRLGIDANPFLGIFFQINGGGTYFMMNKNDEGYEGTVIPFVSGGMGMTLNISSGFGIAISTNYSLYIESSILITGFSPSAGIYLRL